MSNRWIAGCVSLLAALWVGVVSGDALAPATTAGSGVTVSGVTPRAPLRKSDPDNPKVDQGNAKPDTDAAKPDPADSRTETSKPKTDPDNPKEDAGNTKTNTGDGKTDPGSAKTDTGNTKTDTGNSTTETDNTKTDKGDVKTEPGETKNDSGNTKTDTGNTKTDTGNTKTDTGNTKTDTGNTKTDTGNTKTDSGDTKNTPSSKSISSIGEVVVGENPNASIDAEGALVISSSPDNLPPTVVLKTDGTVNVGVKLPPGKPVIFSSNGATQQITDVSGKSQFSTTSKDGVTQVELVKGQMRVDIDKSGTAVSITSTNAASTGSLVTKADKTTVAVVKDETKSLVFVDSGKIDYSSAGKPPISVYQGEISTIDVSGSLVRLTLGSLGGEQQLPGDPLPVDVPKDSLTKIANLAGDLPRFDHTLSLLDIVGDAIKEATGDSSGKLSYDKASGVISYVTGKTIVRLIALGDVLVQLNQFAAATLSGNASVAYCLASRGIEMSLAGALGYFADLQSVVKAADVAAQLSLKPTGAIEIRMLGGRHVVMPGIIASVPANAKPMPGFETDAAGYAVFRDHLGAVQILYPSFLDPDSLNSVLVARVPGMRLTNNGNGTVTATAGGAMLTLRPDYSIIDHPAGRESDAYWMDEGTIYISNSDHSVQGFRLH